MYENRTKENERQNREKFSVNLRQQRREDLIAKRRIIRADSCNLGFEGLRGFRDKILSSDLNEILEGTYSIRRLLSNDATPPIDDVIRANILPRVVGFLSLACPVFNNGNQENIDEIRIEAAWILTNVASGTNEQTEAVVGLGAIKLLIDILGDNIASITLIDQAIWALGNIGGDNEVCRDIIIEHSGGIRMAELISHLAGGDFTNITVNPNIKILRNCTWLLSNLCRGNSPVPSHSHLQFCSGIFGLLVESNDEEIVNDSLWGLAYIADANLALADIVIQSNAPKRAMTLLHTFAMKCKGLPYNAELVTLATYCISSSLRLIGNIISGSNEQTETVLSILIDNVDLLSILYILFYNSHDYKKFLRIRKEVCWIIGNIAAGPINHVDALYRRSLHKVLIDALSGSELYTKTESCYAISNLTVYLSKSMQHYESLVDSDLIYALSSYLSASSHMANMQSVILNIFKSILNAGNIWGEATGQGNSALALFDHDIIGSIEELQDLKDNDVHTLAYNLLVDYFDGVEQ